jgi:hypothetical protein
MAEDDFEDTGPDDGREEGQAPRAAWIAFIGRIIAQVVGAAATVFLGLMLARRLQPTAEAPVPPAASAVPTAARDTGAALAVLPLQNLSGDPSRSSSPTE